MVTMPMSISEPRVCWRVENFIDYLRRVAGNVWAWTLLSDARHEWILRFAKAIQPAEGVNVFMRGTSDHGAFRQCLDGWIAGVRRQFLSIRVEAAQACAGKHRIMKAVCLGSDERYWYRARFRRRFGGRPEGVMAANASTYWPQGVMT